MSRITRFPCAAVIVLGASGPLVGSPISVALDTLKFVVKRNTSIATTFEVPPPLEALPVTRLQRAGVLHRADVRRSLSDFAVADVFGEDAAVAQGAIGGNIEDADVSARGIVNIKEFLVG